MRLHKMVDTIYFTLYAYALALLIITSDVNGFYPISSSLMIRNNNKLPLNMNGMFDEGFGGRNLFLDVNGGKICFDYFKTKQNLGCAVLFLPSLKAPKNEFKSTSLQGWCRKNGYPFLCADYYGVGRSSGDFIDGTVSRWTNDTIELMDKVLQGGPRNRIVLVGHGVGVWISFLIATRRPEMVRGIVGMASDPDFTEELLWKNLNDETKEKIMTNGIHNIVWGETEYPISKNLIEDGRKNLLLNNKAANLDIKCPVRLIHGLRDEEVSYIYALRLARAANTENVKVLLQKGSVNAMDTNTDMNLMRAMIEEVIGDDGYLEGSVDLTSPGSG